MARVIVTSLVLSSLALALPASEENLQPCGDAFYYPSKVRRRFSITMALAKSKSIRATMAISYALYCMASQL